MRFRADCKPSALDAAKTFMRRAVDLEDAIRREDVRLTAIDELVRRLREQAIGDVSEPALVEWVGARLLDWLQSSSDDIIPSVVAQMAAAAEFALDATALASLQARTVPETWQAALGQYAQVGGLMRLFLRTMYSATQDEFAERDIKELGIYRGVNGLPANDAPTWVQPDTWKRGRVDHLSMQPLTCFTSEESIAEGFAAHRAPGAVGLVLRGTIPVIRILSTAWTGFGALHEHEFVILATPGNVQAVQR